MSISQNSVATQRVIRAVTFNQMLFTAGNSLTTGAFLNYFINDFQPTALMLAAVQIAPETSQALSTLSRTVVLRKRNRKRNWLIGLIGGRLAAALVPAALLWPNEPGQSAPLLLILMAIVLWYLLQGFGFVNYISWLSDLVPDVNWGRLFARRQIASLQIALFVPLGASLARDRWLRTLPETERDWSYALLFSVGGLLCLASVIPLLKFPDVPWRTQGETRHLRMHWPREKSFRWLLATRWWLAFFQGLTQTVLFLYSVKVLKVSLLLAQSLTTTMLLLQIPLAWFAGRLSDRDQDKRGLAAGLLIVGAGLPFALLASAENRWPYAAMILLWGAFGLVNVCGHNLCLKLAPRGDNTQQFALYDQASGLIAGGAGLLGGWLLSMWLERHPTEGGLWPYQWLILISWVGRMTTVLWLLPVRQPILRAESDSASALT